MFQQEDKLKLSQLFIKLSKKIHKKNLIKRNGFKFSVKIFLTEKEIILEIMK